MSIIQDTLAKLKSWFERVTKGPAPKKQSRPRRRSRGGRGRSRGQGDPSRRRNQNRPPARKKAQEDKKTSQSTQRKPSPRKQTSKSESTTKKTAPRRRSPRKSSTSQSDKSSGVIRPSEMAGEGRRRSRRRGPRKSSSKSSDSPEIGEITHYFSKIKVAVIKISAIGLRLGDSINIKGSSTDILQKVDSMQIESVDVKSAKKGQMVGLKLKKPARVGDKVYKVA